MKGKYIIAIMMLLCTANLHSQVVVTLPYFDDFESYGTDSIRHIGAFQYYPAYHFFGGWECCSRGYAGIAGLSTDGPMHHNQMYNHMVLMDYAHAINDYYRDTTYDYKCGGTLLASPWFYELPERVSFEFYRYHDTTIYSIYDCQNLPFDIEIGILSDSIPDTTMIDEGRGWAWGWINSWPCNPTCGRDFIPFSTQTFTLETYGWQLFEVNILGMFDGIEQPYRIAFRTKSCDTNDCPSGGHSAFIDDIHIFPANITTCDTVQHTDTACQGATYTGYGSRLISTDSAGTFTHHYTTVVNDSSITVHLLTLTVIPRSDTVLFDTIFVGDSYTFFDSTLTDSGTYIHTTTATNGCDSTVTLHLHTVIRKDTVTISDTICLGTLYDNYGFSVQPTLPGTYTYTRDSASNILQRHYILKLTALPTHATEMHIDINAGDTITFAGTEITDSGTYIFHLTNSYGCDSTVTLTVGINTTPPVNPPPDPPTGDDAMYDIWFPNAITPEQETNNRFRGFMAFIPVKYELYIYNRWGNLVFRTIDPNAEWDGTYKGHIAPQGSYTYKYEVHLPDGRSREGIGTVTLIR